MKYRLELSKHIEFDLSDAVNYYAEVSQDLADDFLIEFQKTISNISNGPKHFQIIRGNTRKANLHRFPYAIFYVIKGEEVYISAIMHLRRHPNVWQTRK